LKILIDAQLPPDLELMLVQAGHEAGRRSMSATPHPSKYAGGFRQPEVMPH